MTRYFPSTISPCTDITKGPFQSSLTATRGSWIQSDSSWTTPGHPTGSQFKIYPRSTKVHCQTYLLISIHIHWVVIVSILHSWIAKLLLWNAYINSFRKLQRMQKSGGPVQGLSHPFVVHFRGRKVLFIDADKRFNTTSVFSSFLVQPFDQFGRCLLISYHDLYCCRKRRRLLMLLTLSFH